MDDFESNFGEMEQNTIIATCDHNYGAQFYYFFRNDTVLSRVSIKC